MKYYSQKEIAEAYNRLLRNKFSTVRNEEDKAIIANDVSYSFHYASYNKERFILGEKIISEDDFYSYLYARDIIDGRFIPGEKTMRENETYWESYLLLCFKSLNNILYL